MTNTQILQFAALISFGICGCAIALLKGTRSAGQSNNFSLSRDTLLTAWERRTLPRLKNGIRDGFHVCPQVRLADLVKVKAPNPATYLKAASGLQRKSIDFIIVCEKTGDAVLGIELDDKTHNRPDRKKRDIYVNHVFQTIGVPLLRVTPKDRINIPDFLRKEEE